ncbi:TetR/AcrR family transcriptional regulator [Gemmatimonas sp.]|uniref:TetR/AcrR family transcriptional regulator n=1 Tax=Gemmatimonas sp. TaxID=1962908 RepID=UPI00286B1158|nr:TetR/AcrR family transcriptional regulator [Gemmatimonas sp.]
MTSIKLQVDQKLSLRDPTSTELGQSIVEHAILLLDELGFEAFTFRKLADRIGTTEPSIYRYFKNKQRLLLYLASWYWSWMEYRIVLATANVDRAEERLRLALVELTRPPVANASLLQIDEVALYRVVVAEASKAYLHRDVDAENREGLFRGYKRLCRAVADIVIEVNPTYRYPLSLVSTMLESARMQLYFAEHLPSLTEVNRAAADLPTTEFLTELVFRAIMREP